MASQELVCAWCGKAFEREGFRANRTAKTGMRAYCTRRCRNAHVRAEVLKKNRPRSDRLPAEERRRRHKASQEQVKQRRLAMELCISCGGDVKAEPGKRYCKRHRELRNVRTIANNRRVKVECFNAYGGCKCSCCGESRLEFLTIDHVNGGGAAHSRELFGGAKGRVGGVRFYLALRRAAFPPGFQVLCFNCNVAKGFFGECPHERERREEARKRRSQRCDA